MMSQGFKRGSRELVQQYQVETRSTSTDMTTIFHALAYDRFIEIQSNLTRKKLNRTNQLPIFLERVLATEIM